MRTTANHLPPAAEDKTLRRILPPHLDYREFRRVPHNPERYVISLLTGMVWDLHRNTDLKPQRDKDGRRRVRLVHPNAEDRYVYCNVIMALIICGPPPSPTAQAHHRDEDPAAPNADRWDNVCWQTPRQNRTRAARHQAQKRRIGTANGRTELTDEQLAEFIRLHDDDRCHHRRIPWHLYASPFFFNVSERQLRRIANEESRGERVAEIRRQIAKENKNGKKAIS